MDKAIINFPAKSVSGSISLPASKSISNRALILNALSNSLYGVKNLSDCDDTLVMQKAFLAGNNMIDVGAAGTSMRFLTAYLSQQKGTWIITGTQRMKNRPIKILVDALRELGAEIEYMENEGFPPLKIKGKVLNGGDVELNSSVSSQYISALLMIAPQMEKGLTIMLRGELISEPYIHMTIQMMSDYGVEVTRQDNQLQIMKQTYSPVQYIVESDWSAASYWYEIVALSSDEKAEIELFGLCHNSMQGDSAVASIFDVLGVETVYTATSVILRKKQVETDCFVYDFVNQPDLAQTVVVTCIFKNIPFVFSGLQSLKIKETDRIVALQNEMRKLGYLISAKNDSILCWRGEQIASENPVAIDTYDDHRMAMAFAPVALMGGEIIVNNPMVVSKSYPNYWDDLQKVGFQII